ncbi:MAG: ribosomal protein L32 [Planctomycetales bacterium]|nr:ribosomal protein L32 [Planctomycetales bacterium]
MDPSGPSLFLVFGCLCIAPVIAILCVILLVWLANRSRDRLPPDAIVACASCGREYPRTATKCPHCGHERGIQVDQVK